MAEEMEVKAQEGGGERVSMKPWEQHSAVISIPRFDYNAPSSLLHHSHSGFLRGKKVPQKKPCPFLKSIYVSSESSDANVAAKRRKLCIAELDSECPSSIESKSAAADFGDSSGKLLENSCLTSAKSDANEERSPTLSLVKLTGSGLLLFTIPRNDSLDVVDTVSKIICFLESGSLNSPLWCHRIFPIQATSRLNEKELCAIVSKLVIQFVNDKRNKLARPIKFAVGYNRRGIEETELKISRNTSKDSEEIALLDRNKCFSVVATAVKDVVPDSVVDLKSPELSVLVELLPISGLPNGSLVVAIAVLPLNLITTKPRLCIKSLLSNTKARNGSKNQ